MRGEALREREEMVCRVNELQEELKVSQDAQVCFFVPGRSTRTRGWVVVFGSVSLLILTLVAHSCYPLLLLTLVTHSCHVFCFLVTGRSTGHVAGWLFLVQCRC